MAVAASGTKKLPALIRPTFCTSGFVREAQYSFTAFAIESAFSGTQMIEPMKDLGVEGLQFTCHLG
jgi:hypothetical protein